MGLKEILIKALMDTLMGMGTVFSILILISLIIYLFKVFFYNNKKSQPEAPGPAVHEEPLKEDDGELIAVITAAIKAFESGALPVMDTPISLGDQQYVVRSIKRRR
ncbi:MAG: OadG family protein [Firmicutes bacterium]|nr:OadG family protein [Bacillota bacterium]MBQ1690921.1 OadG family protein [Bacillota bacterium]MBQ1715046.1 OadG family protein [Bacillota bacterium]